ncbi:hypothetical protein PHLGIDRAFT_321669 [Phlebiopsis gigantea 11061_1 CR5-6]|uniref:Uncharacterized protein n=1 Tax=Phlebiopsis gigantea (strain 11061_1 CR5-6) TaxID=745531 RepID=A0A0C3RQ91_PHLG1|nr:hypothetical protein PHLGIDRAFT_321669 [Phlebiopsis gigantea 11061_1 CR5-6]
MARLRGILGRVLTADVPGPPPWKVYRADIGYEKHTSGLCYGAEAHRLFTSQSRVQYSSGLQGPLRTRCVSLPAQALITYFHHSSYVVIGHRTSTTIPLPTVKPDLPSVPRQIPSSLSFMTPPASPRPAPLLPRPPQEQAIRSIQSRNIVHRQAAPSLSRFFAQVQSSVQQTLAQSTFTCASPAPRTPNSATDPPPLSCVRHRYASAAPRPDFRGLARCSTPIPLHEHRTALGTGFERSWCFGSIHDATSESWFSGAIGDR